MGVPLLLDSTPPTPKPSEDGDNDEGDQVVAELSSQGGELRRDSMSARLLTLWHSSSDVTHKTHIQRQNVVGCVAPT